MNLVQLATRNRVEAVKSALSALAHYSLSTTAAVEQWASTQVMDYRQPKGSFLSTTITALWRTSRAPQVEWPSLARAMCLRPYRVMHIL